jgi:anaerobic selenocysteine-containing dehydrogenase
MTPTTQVEEQSDEDLKVTPPKEWATGVLAVAHAMQYSLEQTSPRLTALTPLNINQSNGIDSPSCAWPQPQPGQQHFNEYCENRAKHINDEATTRRIECDCNTFDRIRPPEVHLVLQMMRPHDQWNTVPYVPYVPDGRYRGTHNGRRVVLVNPADIEELGLANRQVVDVVGTWEDGIKHRAKDFRPVSPDRLRLRGVVLPGNHRAGAVSQRRRDQQHPHVDGRLRPARTGGQTGGARWLT